MHNGDLEGSRALWEILARHPESRLRTEAREWLARLAWRRGEALE
jgi:hypothetical protein